MATFRAMPSVRISPTQASTGQVRMLPVSTPLTTVTRSNSVVRSSICCGVNSDSSELTTIFFFWNYAISSLTLFEETATVSVAASEITEPAALVTTQRY